MSKSEEDKFYQVDSSHGHLIVDRNGKILEVHEHGGDEGALEWYWENAERFLVEEAIAFWNEDPESWDILDLGIQFKDGTKEGPCKTHRRECLRMMMLDGNNKRVTDEHRNFVEWYDKLDKERAENDVLCIYATKGV